MNRFNITSEVFNLLEHAANGAKAGKEFSFFMKGDLNQMSIQKTFLCRHGFKVEQQDVYPVIKETDVLAALKLIYENRVEGWWHYKNKYVEFKICTDDEFMESLKIQCERNK